MAKRKSLKRDMTGTLIPVVIFLVIFYIFNQMLTGDRGLAVWFSLNDQVDKMVLENNALKENIKRLEKKTAKLNEKNPDLDYVDELIRRNLPVGAKNEIVIIVK